MPSLMDALKVDVDKEDSLFVELRKKKKAGSLTKKDLEKALKKYATMTNRFKIVESDEEKELRGMMESKYVAPIGK